MTQRAEVVRADIGAWDGAEVLEGSRFHPYTVRAIRPILTRDGYLNSLDGLLNAAELRGFVGVAELEPAVLNVWSPCLRRWIRHGHGTAAECRAQLAELRRRMGPIAAWLRPGSPE